MDHLLISQMESIDDRFEVVERKGLGHPDTICDALADALSRALCKEYQQRFGECSPAADHSRRRHGLRIAAAGLLARSPAVGSVSLRWPNRA